MTTWGCTPECAHPPVIAYPSQGIDPSPAAEKVIGFMAELGTTTDEIAASLSDWGVKARMSCPSRCVISQFLVMRGLKGVTTHLMQANVDPRMPGRHAMVHFTSEDGWTDSAWLPAVFYDFANDFDHGVYPALVQED